MSTALAARYLSLDEHSLWTFARANGVGPVDLHLNLERWRRADLDRLVRSLEAKPAAATGRSFGATGASVLTETDLDRIASRIQGVRPATDRRLYSLKDAAALCGLSRATLYRMTKRGSLKTIRLGARTLIPAEHVDALIERGG